MMDVIHGYRTIFPAPIAQGASFDPEISKRAASVAARETSAAGIHVVFSPMVDLVRDPRWGRVMESTGEDPYLNSRFAAAQIHGFQGDDMKEAAVSSILPDMAVPRPEGNIIPYRSQSIRSVSITCPPMKPESKPEPVWS